MPEKRGVRSFQADFDGIVVDFSDAFYRIGILQAVEIGIIAAVDVMPGMLPIEYAREAEHHVVRVHGAGRGKPGGFLERNVTAQVKTVGGAVIQRLPAFRQFRDQTIGIGIDIQQAVVELSGKGINDQAAAGQLWIEGIHDAADAVDETAVTNIFWRRGMRCRAEQRKP